MENLPEVIIYTDGASSPNPGTGGYGALLICKGREKEISGAVPNTTNNRMELTAALKALELLTRPAKVTVYTDSRYLCDAFKKNWLKGWQKRNWITSQKTPVLNRDLWEALLVQAAKHQITWEWVKGHSDNEGNNRCDKLATQARIDYDAQQKELKK